MTAKITVGPPVLTINRGSTFMVSDYRGEVDPAEAQGVFAEDTRFVSGYRLSVNGRRWERLSSATVSYRSARFYLTNPVLRTYGGELAIPGDSLSLTLSRSVEEGICERFELTNHGPDAVRLVLELELLSDFADLFEVKAGQFRQRENLVTQWDGPRAELTTAYRNQDFTRRFTYKVGGVDPPPTYANGRLLFPIHLEARASWTASGQMMMAGREGSIDHRRSGSSRAADAREDWLHERWVSSCASLWTPDDDLRHAYAQSVEDMGALRLFELDLRPDVWVPAAGVPWFVTVFGRDSLVASLQNMAVQARFAEGTLRTLARYQARERDDWRDAQPGKIVHEIRHGELAHFDVVPHTRYYGTWDATPLFLIVLHEAWRWLGDRRLVEELLPVAERCLAWIDADGDPDGDGFQEYRTYSKKGYENMGWKDAADAVVYPDGSQVAQPKALCELQGYVYAAKRGMAELFAALGDHGRADALSAQAAELKRRFDEAFWMEDEGTYAFGLDPDKRRVETVVSNAGHCLWSGIAGADKAGRVVERLLRPDLWSGWGIRTLSSDNRAYDPFSYQRGSVWPHDNGIIAAGMKRYGYHEQANRVARAILDAAARFQNYRLPEVFAGLRREPDAFPVQYRGANIPQTWAAGSIFHVVQAMLGLRADAPNGRLWVDPTLPEWAPSLRLNNLQVGPVRLDLRFWRAGDDSRFEVMGQHGGRIDVCQEEK